MNLSFGYNTNGFAHHKLDEALSITAEIRYVGTRGVHLDVQNRINRRALVSEQAFLPTFLRALSPITWS